MKKTDKNLYLLFMLFGVALVTANCIGSKLFVLPFNMFGAPVVITAGAICYPITFLCTDIIGEIWGAKKANIAVLWGFVCQCFSTTIIIMARFLPAADSSVQASYVSLLGQNWVFVLASLSAYLVSQKCDVLIFHGIRNAWINKHGNTKGGKWLWNNVGTISAQFIDTVIYATVAFGLGFGWLWNGKLTYLINMILAQWLIKVLLALADTPVFYLLTRGSDKI